MGWLVSTTAVALGLSVSLFALATEPAAPRPPPQPAPAAVPAGGGAPSDAAKHARRTQCLTEARARKIVGARRTAFVHTCLAQQ